MNSIEEIINITMLKAMFEEDIKRGSIGKILDEIILQSKVEFNYEEIDVDEDEEDESENEEVNPH